MESITYTVVRSDRKTVSIRITVNGQVEVRAPLRLSDDRIREFVMEKERWIRKHMQGKETGSVQKLSNEELHALADSALKIIPQRVAHFAPLVGVSYGRITIRNQKTRWGSCSTAGNLNFNCLLLRVPPDVLDYVVVHELCHRKEMNHASRFWAEVERVCPNYRECRQWLKKNGNALIAMLP